MKTVHRYVLEHALASSRDDGALGGALEVPAVPPVVAAPPEALSYRMPKTSDLNAESMKATRAREAAEGAE